MKDVDLKIWTMGSIAPENIQLQIEEFIADTIAEGTVAQLPSQRNFARTNNLNPSLVKRAFFNLTVKGLLYTKDRSGTYVANYIHNKEMVYQQSPFTDQLPVPLPPPAPAAAEFPPVVHNFSSLGIDRLSEFHYPKSLHKYLKLHRKRYKEISQIDRVMDAQSIQYKQAARKYVNMHAGLKLNADCMTIAMGRQEALQHIFSLLLNPGALMVNTAAADIVLRNVLQHCKARVCELNTNDPGFLEELENCLINNPVKAIYINSQCSNPECQHLSEQTCLELIKLVRKYGVYIVEENDFHEFWYVRDREFMPLARYDHNGHVIYTAPLSQTSVYMYNTRIIGANKALISALEAQPSRPYELRNVIEELAIVDLINSGELRAHVKHIRSIKEQHRDDLYLELDNYLGPWMEIRKPDSGLCFWVTFPPEVDIHKAMGYINGNSMDIPYNPFVPQVLDKVYHMRLAFGTFNIMEAQAAAKLVRRMFEDLGLKKILPQILA